MLETPSNSRKLQLSTKCLEALPGDMLDDPGLVFDGADAVFAQRQGAELRMQRMQGEELLIASPLLIR